MEFKNVQLLNTIIGTYEIEYTKHFFDIDTVNGNIKSQYHYQKLFTEAEKSSAAVDWRALINIANLITGGFDNSISVDVSYCGIKEGTPLIRLISKRNDGGGDIKIADFCRQVLKNKIIKSKDVECHMFSESGRSCDYVYYYDLSANTWIAYLLHSNGYIPTYE